MSGRGLLLIYPLSSALCSPADLPQTEKVSISGQGCPFSGAVWRGIPPQSSLLREAALRVFSCP